MRHTARVNVISRNHSRRVVADGNGALIRTLAYPRNVEGRQFAVGSTQEAMIDIIRVREGVLQPVMEVRFGKARNYDNILPRFETTSVSVITPQLLEQFVNW